MPDKKEVTDFIKLMQSLSEQEQAGLLMMTQGAKLLAQKKKQRITHCSNQ